MQCVFKRTRFRLRFLNSNAIYHSLAPRIAHYPQKHKAIIIGQNPWHPEYPIIHQRLKPCYRSSKRVYTNVIYQSSRPYYGCSKSACNNNDDDAKEKRQKMNNMLVSIV